MSPEAIEGAAITAVPASELSGRWIYHRDPMRWAGGRLTKHFVQAVRGGIVLELSQNPRHNSHPQLIAYPALEIVLIQTVEEELASRPSDDPRNDDTRRMDHLAQLHRAGYLASFINLLPPPHLQPDLRAALDAASEPP